MHNLKLYRKHFFRAPKKKKPALPQIRKAAELPALFCPKTAKYSPEFN